ncbi:MAG: hypothetical protein GF346_06210 [Candidatus Eisenbacteria bacterium]|nr:hypothetical protein [Candidatus Latescibacterota bacterium]MBD3302019.1 hypothetical protein [Candidatus Eisenbacteria bacterium]
MKRIPLALPLLAVLSLIGSSPCPASPVTGDEPIVGTPCEGCEEVFNGIPDSLTSAARIAPRDYPGEPLRITGTVLRPDGTPAPGTVVYAYHTNAGGIYPEDEDSHSRHGALRGWTVANADGRYRFETIRPGGYPRSTMPQHLHMHVIEPGRCTYYIDDIVFTDDPRLAPERREQYTHGRGGSGVVTPRRDEEGTWIVERDILLGSGIPGYPDPVQGDNGGSEGTGSP